MSTIVVVEVERGADGIYVAHLPPIYSSKDLDTVPRLDGFAQEKALVRWGNEAKTLTVYRKGSFSYVRAEDLSRSP